MMISRERIHKQTCICFFVLPFFFKFCFCLYTCHYLPSLTLLMASYHHRLYFKEQPLCCFALIMMIKRGFFFWAQGKHKNPNRSKRREWMDLMNHRFTESPSNVSSAKVYNAIWKCFSCIQATQWNKWEMNYTRHAILIINTTFLQYKVS